MVSAREIREKGAQWLFGVISLREFEDWFVPETWDAHQAKDSEEAENLADDIEMSLSEYTSGHISEEQLRGALAGILLSFAENRVGDESPLGTPESNSSLANNALNASLA